MGFRDLVGSDAGKGSSAELSDRTNDIVTAFSGFPLSVTPWRLFADGGCRETIPTRLV